MDNRVLFAYGLLWLVLLAYALLASVDLGAGFYAWIAGRIGREDVRRVTHAYLSPVWETTNVFLILFLVGMVGFFPASAHVYGTALLVPLSLAVLALVIRGAAFAFAHVASRCHASLALISGFAGLLVPVLLVSYLSAGEDGAISLTATGTVTVSQPRLWFSPLALALDALALAAPLYLGPVFLARYAARHGEPSVAGFFRRAARRAAPGMALLALVFAVTLATGAPWHARALIALWPLHLVLIALFVVGIYALRRDGAGWSGVALGTLSAQFGLALLAYGFTRLPYLLYPGLRADAALTPQPMFVALTVTIVLGSLVLLPSLGLLYVLFVRPNTLLLPAAGEHAGPVEAPFVVMKKMPQVTRVGASEPEKAESETETREPAHVS